ncbi:MAG: WD40 repeat domain-containing protein [Pseudomonadota bacterium]
MMPRFAETAFERRSLTLETGAPVTGAVATSDAVVAGFGDGTLRFFTADGPSKAIQSHSGVVLCLAAQGSTVISGGDDGRLVRTSHDGRVEELATFGSRWVDCVAATVERIACSAGRNTYLWRSWQGKPTVFEHDSTVGGLAFDGKGKRLAVGHYGGATLWERGSKRWVSTKLPWKGSHGAVSFSPDNRFLISTMQENAVHGWRLRDKCQLAMPGYPAKIKSFTWVGTTPHLATSGADEAICWPFDGKDGPMERKPLSVAPGGQQLATCVEGLPMIDALFVGFQDDAVILAELDEDKDINVIRGSKGDEVTAMKVSSEHSHVLIGDAAGRVLWAKMWADEG